MSPTRRWLPLILVLAVDMAQADALSRSEDFTPSLSFAETRTERVVNRINPDFPALSFPEVVSLTRTDLLLVADMSQVNLDAIDETTSISLSFGDSAATFKLGQDPDYRAGKTKAFFPSNGWDDKGQAIGSEGLSLNWNSKSLTITLRTSTDDDGEQTLNVPAIAAGFVGEQDSSIRVLADLKLSFGPLEADAVCFVAGSASTRQQSVNFGGFSESFSLTEVSLNAVLDVTAPEVSISGIVKPTAARSSNAGTMSTTNSRGKPQSTTESGDDIWLDDPVIEQPTQKLVGTAVDARGVTAVRVKLPGSQEWVEATIDEVTSPVLPDEWGRTQVRWELPLDGDLSYGKVSYSVVAEDLAGNCSEPKVFSIVNELPASLAGRWDATVRDSGGILNGSITLMVSTQGKVSGLLRNQQGQWPFVGDWYGMGITCSIPRTRSQPALNLVARLPSVEIQEGGELELHAALTEATADDQSEPTEQPWEFVAVRSPFSVKSPLPAELIGRYHLILVGASEGSDLLSGDSHAIVLTQKNGSSSVIGQLADGTSWTWSGPVGANASIPVLQYLYGRKGLIAGSLLVDGETLWGEGLRWKRPAGLAESAFIAGFDLTDLSAEGQRYRAPARGEMPLGIPSPQEEELNTSIEISAHGLAEVLGTSFTLSAKGSATFPAPNELSLRAQLNNSSGLWTGSAILPFPEGNSKISFRGLVVGTEIRGFAVGNAPTPGTPRVFGSVRVNTQQSQTYEDDYWTDIWWWWEYFCSLPADSEIPDNWPKELRWWFDLMQSR
jgi:hypothetical protein